MCCKSGGLIVSARFFLSLRLRGDGLDGPGDGAAKCSLDDIGEGLKGKGFDIAATADLGSGGTGGKS